MGNRTRADVAGVLNKWFEKSTDKYLLIAG